MQNLTEKKVLFDKRYYDNLSEREFHATVVHELGHIKARQCFKTYLKIITWASPLLLLVMFGTIIGVGLLEFLKIVIGWIFYLIVLMRAMHRNHEFEADRIAYEYQDEYDTEDLISAIYKADCKYSKKFTLLTKVFPHPTKEERSERISRHKIA